MQQTFAACPTAIVEAPIEVVWDLLLNVEAWGTFYDLRVLSVEPPGRAAAGTRLVGESGPRWLHLRIAFDFRHVDEANHRLEFDGRLPLGLAVHESLDCTRLPGERCRVNYHCNFDIPTSWRGLVIRRFLNRELSNGPLDSIQRLTRSAEEAYARQLNRRPSRHLS